MSDIKRGCGPAFGDVTKRELFAAMAMQGILSRMSQNEWENSPEKFIALNSCRTADALIAALSDEVTK